MINWLKRLWNWLTEPKLLWLTLVVLIGSFLCAFFPVTNEPRIRIVGLALQLFGVMTVAWGVSETRKLFGRPSIFSIALEWLKRFPPFRRGIVLSAGTGEYSLEGFSAKANVWSNPGPNPSLEERVLIVEMNINNLRDRTSQIEQQVDEETRARQQAEISDRQAREQADQDTRHKLELTETGGLHISLMGILWLSVGLILSSMSNEIFRFMN